MAVPGWAQRILRPFQTLIDRLVSVGFITSGVVLAAQTFLALIPLLLAAASLLPSPTSTAIQQSLRDRFGLSGSTDAAVTSLVGHRDDLAGGFTVVGILVVLASATSFTRALQRVYEGAWGLPRLGLRASLRGLVWLVGMVAYLAVLNVALRLAGSGTPGTVARAVLLVLGSVVLWWWTPYLLLVGRVRPRALLPTGLFTAAAMAVLGVAGSVYVPRSVRSNERQFGTIGVVFAIESWLVVIGCTLVATAVTGAVLAQLDGPVGRIARGRADVEGWRSHKTLTSVTGAGVTGGAGPSPTAPAP